MGHENGRIFAPVNTDDVVATIGVNSHDVATLCMANDRINMWARNKPEATGGPAALSDADRKANNFGLRMPTTYTTVANYVNAANNVGGVQMSGWTYAGPVPGTDWFRLTDFDNYRSDAVSPFPSLMQGDYVFGQATDGTKTLSLPLAFSPQGSLGTTDYINLSDLKMSGASYADWYPGIMLYKNSTTYYLSTASSTVSQGGSPIQFNQSNGMVVPPEGAYKAHVFFANKTFAISSVGSSAVSALQLIPITTQPVDVNLITSASALVVYCAIQGSKVAVTVTNKNAQVVNITPVEFQHNTSASETGATKISPIETLTTFSVPAGSSASPQVVSKTYRLPIVGVTGFIRLVYKQQIGTGTTSSNMTTPWTALYQEVG